VRRKIIVVLVIGALYAETVEVVRRRGFVLGIDTVVRCRSGHLFTTMWIPAASFKAIRLGWWRFQRCPVGNHWALVTPVKEADLTEEEWQFAAQHRDVRIP
jgi:hypothetical protein